MRLIPTSFTQKTADPNDPTGGKTLAALVARQRALREAAAPPPARIASPWQGAAYMLDSFVNAREQHQAEAQETAGRAKLAQTIGGINWDSGASPEQIGTMMSLDPDTGLKFIADAMTARRAAATHAQSQADELTQEQRANAEWRSRNEITNTQDIEKAKLAAGGKAPQGFETEQNLRKEYSALPLIKSFPVVQTGLERMQTGAADNSPVGDIALIYGFMKLQDPDSVVREGEYATAQNAAGVGDRVMNLYNRVISGERLTPQQREEFLRVGAQQYQSISNQVGDTNSRFSQIATNYGVDPSRIIVVPKAFEVPGKPQPEPTPAGAPLEPGQASEPGDAVIPQHHIEMLLTGTGTPEDFDTAYGPGAAAKIFKLYRGGANGRQSVP